MLCYLTGQNNDVGFSFIFIKVNLFPNFTHTVCDLLLLFLALFRCLSLHLLVLFAESFANSLDQDQA